MDRQFALVSHLTVGVHPLADPNAWSVQNVLPPKLAYNRSVWIPVLELADSTLNVTSSTTAPFAAVFQVIRETHSLDVLLFHVSYAQMV